MDCGSSQLTAKLAGAIARQRHLERVGTVVIGRSRGNADAGSVAHVADAASIGAV